MSEIQYDYSGDGVADAVEITGGPGDAFVHTTAIDADQNGIYETIHVDSDGDLQAEVTFFDADQDGVIEAGQIDQSGNSIADTYVYDTNADGVLDVRVDDLNENGVSDANEVVTASPAPAAGFPSLAETQAMIAQSPSLIGLYEQILNTPVDPNDAQAVADKAKVLALVAEAVQNQQRSTAAIIDGM